MTTTIKVISHNSPAHVQTFDRDSGGDFPQTSEQIVRVEDGEVTFHCTTTRKILVVDLEPSHPSYKKSPE